MIQITSVPLYAAFPQKEKVYPIKKSPLFLAPSRELKLNCSRSPKNSTCRCCIDVAEVKLLAKITRRVKGMNAEDVPIPIDFFISRKLAGLSHGERGFADSLGSIVYRVKAQPESHTIKLVLDAAGRPVCSILQCQGGSWQVFRSHDDDEKDLICDVKITRSSFTRRELDVLMNPENSNLPPLKMKGFLFQRSCTIYGSDSIIAQTSLMYKLNQIYARRNKYRLTIFPGFADHVLLVALVVIFFYGKK